MQTVNVSCHDVNHVPFVNGQLQKNGVRLTLKAIKSVKGVSCIDQVSSVQPVTDVCTVA